MSTYDEHHGAEPPLPNVSIIIRAFNEATVLPVTLRAVDRQRIDGVVEVIVVDSGSTDQTRRIAEDAGARVVCLDREYRPGYAVNVGVAASRAPICVLLSAPAFPADDLWLARLVGPLMGAPGGPAVTFSRHRPLLGACPSEDAFLAQAFTDRTTTAIFSATGGAFRREVWEGYPWSLDILPGGPDDREWSVRIRADGYHIQYVPDSVVVRSHRLDAAGWFRRVYADASAERAIVARWGAPSSPTQSGVQLARSTFASLVRSGDLAEVVRFALLLPVVTLARSPIAPRMGTAGMRVIDVIGRLDRRVFAPHIRWDRAFARFVASYWAFGPSQPGAG